MLEQNEKKRLASDEIQLHGVTHHQRRSLPPSQYLALHDHVCNRRPNKVSNVSVVEPAKAMSAVHYETEGDVELNTGSQAQKPVPCVIGSRQNAM